MPGSEVDSGRGRLRKANLIKSRQNLCQTTSPDQQVSAAAAAICYSFAEARRASDARGFDVELTRWGDAGLASSENFAEALFPPTGCLTFTRHAGPTFFYASCWGWK